MAEPVDRTDVRPVDRRSRRPTGPVTRAVVLTAALEVIDRDGVDALSMRRLAEAVGRDPMVIYRHVPN
ncbi:TetR/AcrR family transcriptional regulator, partial [Nocardia sp. NPDC047654]|uniref:TetR/AcrR family transcriptional regulator n=1 Tax=Nocardia sp. NPDC047654 TaxID=3364314 RepID=UPI00371695E0